MAIREVAEKGFGREAETYERARPIYPPDALAWLVEGLGIRPGTTVVDLAAGTGKLTRLILPTGATVVAVEPVGGMRRILRQVVASVPVVAGTAEAMPFAAGSLDAVAVAQAFHWFDAEGAFDELARVLRSGGRVGMVWNARDRSVDWVDRICSIMDRVEKQPSWRDYDGWGGPALGRRGKFGPLHEATFRHDQAVTPDDVVGHWRSVSYVAVLPAERRDEVLAEVREVLACHPQTRGRQELRMPYRVDCLWCERC